MKDKKGAIEISVSTIIIIIIGVSLLTLGLLWVKNVFKGIEGLSDKAFRFANDEISEIFENTDSPLVIAPTTLTIPQGKTKWTKIIITNFEENPIQIYATVTCKDSKLKAAFSDTESTRTNTYTITSGSQEKIALLIAELKGSVGTKVCNIEVTGLTGDNTESIIINVEPAESFLGIF